MPEGNTNVTGILVQSQIDLKMHLDMFVWTTQMCLCTWDQRASQERTVKEGVSLNESKPIKMVSAMGGERELLSLYGICQLDLSPKSQKTGFYGKQASTNGRSSLSENSIVVPSPSKSLLWENPSILVCACGKSWDPTEPWGPKEQHQHQWEQICCQHTCEPSVNFNNPKGSLCIHLRSLQQIG